jgi:hypothetical protein
MSDLESDNRSQAYMMNNTMHLNKDNIQVFGILDRKNNRYIICEKTYEVQKYYVLQHDEQRYERGLEDVLQVIQYVCVQVNIGTKQYGRGKRGIEVDTREFMALRNLVHFYSPNPFLSVSAPNIYDSSGGPVNESQQMDGPKLIVENTTIFSGAGPVIFQKDLFL